MDLIKTMMANRKEKGLLLEPPRDKKATAKPIASLPGKMGEPSPSAEIEMMKKDIIAKKPRAKIVREYFQHLIDYKNGRAEAAEARKAAEED